MVVWPSAIRSAATSLRRQFKSVDRRSPATWLKPTAIMQGVVSSQRVTAVWAFLATSILALPVAGVLRRFRWAAILTVIVLECGVPAVNGGRCPLSDLAARFTLDRNSNFDIWPTTWLAQHNKLLFWGWLFVAVELIVVGCWLQQTFATPLRTVNCPSYDAKRKRPPSARWTALSWRRPHTQTAHRSKEGAAVVITSPGLQCSLLPVPFPPRPWAI